MARSRTISRSSRFRSLLGASTTRKLSSTVRNLGSGFRTFGVLSREAGFSFTTPRRIK